MKSDRDRWDRKYREHRGHGSVEPDAVLLEYCHLLDGRGEALDVACGSGANACFLAELGYDVVGIDVSIEGLCLARREAASRALAIKLIVADLDVYPLPLGRFDLVLVVKYLNRERVSDLKQALTPGGLMIYRTFNQNFLAERPRFRREYVVAPGELSAWFSDLELIATNDSPELRDTQTFWIGRAPSPSPRSPG